MSPCCGQVKDQAADSKAMFYTEDSFQSTKTRSKAIRDYLHCLRGMYEKEHGVLAQDGKINWDKVVAQAPKFFEQRHHALVLKGAKSSTCGAYVLQELHKHVLQPKGFPKLLTEIASSGVIVLLSG